MTTSASSCHKHISPVCFEPSSFFCSCLNTCNDCIIQDFKLSRDKCAISHVKIELGSNIERLCASAVGEWCADWHCSPLYFYTDCTRRNMPYFRRTLLGVVCVDTIKNICIQRWTGTKIIIWEKRDLVVPQTASLLHVTA